MTKRTLVLCLTAIALSLLTDRGSAQSLIPICLRPERFRRWTNSSGLMTCCSRRDNSSS